MFGDFLCISSLKKKVVKAITQISNQGQGLLTRALTR